MKPTTTALVLVSVLVVYLVGGMVLRPAPAPVQAATTEDQTFSVRVASSAASVFTENVTVRGVTEALRRIELRAELEGAVMATPVERGTRVKTDDVICAMDAGPQRARVSEAKALLDQRLIELGVARELNDRGVRTKGQLAAAEANTDSARALLKQRERELRIRTLRAPFDAYVDDRPAEVGAFLQKGQVCAVLMQHDPMLVVAEVSEDYVAKVKPGQGAYVRVKGGAPLDGTVRFVAAIANPATRAFRVEVAVKNSDFTLRDGQTATLDLGLGQTPAHLVAPSTLVLGAGGQVGVRSVGPDSKVVFHPVDILNDDPMGIWVTGLPPQLDIITVGQAFVAAGDLVAAVKDPIPAGAAQ